MMDTLKNTLRAGAQLRRRVMRDVAATRGPDSRVSYSLNELERQHPPRSRQPRNIKETEHVPSQAHAQHLKFTCIYFKNKSRDCGRLKKNARDSGLLL